MHEHLNDNQVEFGIGGKTFFKVQYFSDSNSFKNSIIMRVNDYESNQTKDPQPLLMMKVSSKVLVVQL